MALRSEVRRWTLEAALLAVSGCPRSPATPSVTTSGGRRLSHAETLAWITSHRAWRPARKSKPMWARSVRPGEVGKPFQTANHAVERADADHWLCVRVAGEPWFQAPAKIDAKYARTATERRQFAFDDAPRGYGVFVPREGARNWAAPIESTYQLGE